MSHLLRGHPRVSMRSHPPHNGYKSPPTYASSVDLSVFNRHNDIEVRQAKPGSAKMAPKAQKKVQPPVSTLPISYIISRLKNLPTAASAREYITTHNLDALKALKVHLPAIFYDIQTTERGRSLQVLARTLVYCQNHLYLNPGIKSLPFPAREVTMPPPESLATAEADEENWQLLASCVDFHSEILGSPLTPEQSATLRRRLLRFWLLLLACVPEVEDIAEDIRRLETLAGRSPRETYLDMYDSYSDEEKGEFYLRGYVKVTPYFLWLKRQGCGSVKELNVAGEAGARILRAVGIRGAEYLGGLEMAREVLLTLARTHVEFTAGLWE
ncbi:hypothetical protein L873DRAFT_1805248 [Choiromyces venosus 120613-1]|uniref:Uncharacterized protein n=1 Tax=Choiromyces venosus 120613-1 TaxID=1336337 RepID=A0A3N4K3B6_9PEZI|nr:hypothetical protein L873DRAFT_1805248 [Choiromyces venosus 120613-1]